MPPQPAIAGRTSEFQRSRKPAEKRSFWKELPILIVIALALSFVLQNFVARVYLIPSESMVPTLEVNDRIVVEKVSFKVRDVRPGDVVVFRGPAAWSQTYKSIRSDNPVIRGFQNFGATLGLVPPDENDLVKRVIAVGGQKVECCDEFGRILVDGKAIEEPYVTFPKIFAPATETCTTPKKSARCFGPYTIAPDTVWVMGDNRANSADSTYHACLARMPDNTCKGDGALGMVPVENVIGKAVFRILPLGRAGSIESPDLLND